MNEKQREKDRERGKALVNLAKSSDALQEAKLKDEIVEEVWEVKAELEADSVHRIANNSEPYSQEKNMCAGCPDSPRCWTFCKKIRTKISENREKNMTNKLSQDGGCISVGSDTAKKPIRPKVCTNCPESTQCTSFCVQAKTELALTEATESAKKPTNPKEALGIAKVPMHCVPSAPLLEVALAMMEGGRKYGTHNYREMGVRVSTYYDAVMRHIIAWWEGEDIDPDSGVHHVVKAIACLFVLRDSMCMGNCKDDRPIKYAGGLDMSKLNKLAEGLIEKYPTCAKPFLEKK